MGPYYVIIIPALGGIVVGFLTTTFAREAKGHGVPEVMLAVARSGGRIRFRVSAVKALASSICIGSGGSVGREGPIVQIASSLGSGLGQLFRLDEDKIRVLVACGAAAGVAATFNAPIAGTFFALEVILRKYSQRFFSAIVLSSMIATLISRHHLGDRPAFVTPVYQFNSLWELLFYLIFGFIAAFLGLAFIKLLYGSEDLFDSLKIPEIIKPAIGGVLIGAIGFCYPQIFGVGYEAIDLALFGKISLIIGITLVFLKIVATSLTLGSGGSGGIFAPSLFIGAMAGEAYGKLTYLVAPAMAIPPGACALVGMAAVFAGAAQAPFTAVLILFEMTGDYRIILPLMITCIISTLVVRKLSSESIYTLKLKRRGIDIDRVIEQDMMEHHTVAEAMIENPATLNDSDALDKAEALIEFSGHYGFPVLDSTGKLVGVLASHDILEAHKRAFSDESRRAVLVREIMTSSILVCYPDEKLHDVLDKMGERNIDHIPVVERNDTSRLVGLITGKNVIALYHRFCNIEDQDSIKER
ncbi:MAG: chloride channel protein [Candidatus Eremiobacteraeota bacterium]|nr:chloride channel protein [Candidatus Eremiobacteraeota bacterium]